MKLKKILILMLVCVLCISFVGCGSEGNMDAGKESVNEKQEENVEKVFVDDDNCTFKISAIEEDEIWGYTLKADLENKTDKNLMFSLENVSVNGFMCDPFWACSVQSGKKAKSDISFSETAFKELGIEKVEEIEFTLSVSDEDDWEAEDLINETFTYTID